MEFLRLCTFQNLSGDDLQRFKQLVIDERVNINKTYQDGRSPLDVLCSDDYQNKDNNVLELVQLLLERGDVNVNPKLLLTLLRNWRIREHIIELVKIFMERGCDVNAKDKDGWTPLLLLFRCYKIGDSLLDLFTILVEAGADLTAKTTDGYNVLHWFFHWNQDHSSKTIDLIRYLIEKGVDVNARNMSGENPLHILCRLCTNEETLLILVKLLKENGIDLRAETKQGKTASFILRFENQAKLQANLKIDKVIDELSN